MGFRVALADGTINSYEDGETYWTIDSGVLKLGDSFGEWTTFISPSGWTQLDSDDAVF